MQVVTAERTLAVETWAPTSSHDFVLSFLRGEWGKIACSNPIADKRLITHPELDDSNQNQLRAQLLFGIRGALLNRIPADTKWFKVEYLRPVHFCQLHAICCEGWIDSRDMNELVKVAVRMPIELGNTSPESWEPILWGHSKRGPFSILEGNHRLTALAGRTEMQDLAMLSYVGISDQKCVWHCPDWR